MASESTPETVYLFKILEGPGMVEKAQAKERVRELVERFQKEAAAGRLEDYSEADVGSKFILPLLEALGWNTKNIEEVKEQRTTLTGPSDYVLSIKRRPKLVLELKRFSKDLDGYDTVKGKKRTHPEQALGYAWHLKVDWTVLTNFKEIRLYYTHVRDPEEGLVFRLTADEFLERFEELWTLARDAVQAGRLDGYERKRTRKDIDAEILDDLFEVRKVLALDIRKNNPEVDAALIRESVQKILDRLVVIRVAEDREIVGRDSLRNELEAWRSRGLETPFTRKIKGVFRDFDEVYNGELFREHPCEGLRVSNAAMERTIETLYSYNFDLISADVLGSIYENYIGHVLKETSGGAVKIVEERMVRKASGIYYTPTYIVEYIVNNTVRVKLEEIWSEAKVLLGRDKLQEAKEKILEISKLKVLDPACGSGSFLIKAFDVIREYYERFNQAVKEKTKRHGIEANAHYVTSIEKRILEENLYGVDLDPQAAEIASVNLMLKALRKGERLPLILGQNIRVGNSLIGGTGGELKKYFGEEWKEKRHFNWEEGFPMVFRQGGFDVVIGNPPWGGELPPEEDAYFRAEYPTVTGEKDTYRIFMERALAILAEDGRHSFVVPNTWMVLDRSEKMRRHLLTGYRILSILDLAKYIFQDAPDTVPCIYAIQKANAGVKINGNITHVRTIPLKGTLEDVVASNWRVDDHVPQASWLKNPRAIITLERSGRSYQLTEKIRSHATCLVKNIAELHQGAAPKNYPKYVSLKPKHRWVRAVVGRDIKPNVVVWGGHYVQWAKPTDTPYIKEGLEKTSKIIVQRVRKLSLKRRIIAAYDAGDFVPLDSTSYLTSKNPQVDLFLLAVLNSTLLNYLFRIQFHDITIKSSLLGELPLAGVDIKSRKLTGSVSKKISSLASRTLSLHKTLHPLSTEFTAHLATRPVISTLSLITVLDDLPPGSVTVPRGINTVRSRNIHLRPREEGNELVLLADYDEAPPRGSPPGKRGLRRTDVEVLRAKISDLYLRGFLLHHIASEPKAHRLGSGLILKKVHAIGLPKFSTDMEEHRSILKKLMAEYLPKVEERARWEREIEETDRAIDKLVYELYGLTPAEVAVVEECEVEEVRRKYGW